MSDLEQACREIFDLIFRTTTPDQSVEGKGNEPSDGNVEKLILEHTGDDNEETSLTHKFPAFEWQPDDFGPLEENEWFYFTSDVDVLEVENVCESGDAISCLKDNQNSGGQHLEDEDLGSEEAHEWPDSEDEELKEIMSIYSVDCHTYDDESSTEAEYVQDYGASEYNESAGENEDDETAVDSANSGSPYLLGCIESLVTDDVHGIVYDGFKCVDEVSDEDIKDADTEILAEKFTPLPAELMGAKKDISCPFSSCDVVFNKCWDAKVIYDHIMASHLKLLKGSDIQCTLGNEGGCVSSKSNGHWERPKLAGHIAVVHCGVRFTCACGFSGVREDEIKRHLKQTGCPYCRDCREIFPSAQAREEHMLSCASASASSLKRRRRDGVKNVKRGMNLAQEAADEREYQPEAEAGENQHRRKRRRML
ncbi:hypothetical protein EW145_g1553 [Phellinidium pouzarii]|uniref:Uncharacterized protein n=1 Tax=Phellinidium pouzarii TaxID=167371 RepID=A0A4S4LEM0_9AGAM|nr:hypothetical protein EW145_g1553 [Phellinidium pouzarii]